MLYTHTMEYYRERVVNDIYHMNKSHKHNVKKMSDPKGILYDSFISSSRTGKANLWYWKTGQ